MAGAKCSAPNRTRPGSCGRTLNQGVCPNHGTAGAGTPQMASVSAGAMAAVAEADPWQPRYRTELTGAPDGDWERVRTGWTHPETGTSYDPDGFNREGYDADGYDADGYNRGGFDRGGFDRDGFDGRGFDADGIHPETQTSRDPSGRDANGRDVNGWTAGAYRGSVNGLTGTPFSPDGYDAGGFDTDGFDRGGHDVQGFHRDTGLHKKTGERFGPAGHDGERRSRTTKVGDYEVVEVQTADGQTMHEATFLSTSYDEEGYDHENEVVARVAFVESAEGANHYKATVDEVTGAEHLDRSDLFNVSHEFHVEHGKPFTKKHLTDALDEVRGKVQGVTLEYDRDYSPY